jgi:hypothetical protein
MVSAPVVKDRCEHVGAVHLNQDGDIHCRSCRAVLLIDVNGQRWISRKEARERLEGR